MKIPKSFKLFATTINVVFDNEKLSNENHLFGLTEYSKALITLCTVRKGTDLPEDLIIDSFYHEKVHSILDAMGEFELSGNEKFVEVFSRLLRQSDESAEFKLKQKQDEK